MIFQDRNDAGKRLALLLSKYKFDNNAIVLGLPRGGVVIAYEVAKHLKLPIDVIITRKIGLPEQTELAIGAVTQEGEPIFDYKLAEIVGVDMQDLDSIVKNEKIELKRRLALYRKGLKELDLTGKTAILVDDGLATGYTMRASIASAKNLGAKKVVIAVPVSSKEALYKIKALVDEVFCLYAPESFSAIGQFYQEFEQVSDDQVLKLLKDFYGD